MKSTNQVFPRARRFASNSILAARSNFIAKVNLSQLFVLVLLVAAYAGSASAVPITYVFTGTASGTLGVGDGQISFEGASPTVTASGNTDNVIFHGISTYTTTTC